ncbi:hypothetical protein BaRGS_00005513 [Batillaria attramentaria]|uniref:Uncharacterized protein n=1 Tax=Batillaria attramentaria TaxID=370345 RepID=A0ABD0LVL8_9CAEN
MTKQSDKWSPAIKIEYSRVLQGFDYVDSVHYRIAPIQRCRVIGDHGIVGNLGETDSWRHRSDYKVVRKGTTQIFPKRLRAAAKMVDNQSTRM